MKYLVECGSRSYNIQTNKSDVDVVLLDNIDNSDLNDIVNLINQKYNKTDFHKIDLINFFKNIKFDSLNCYGCQLLYPSKFLINNDLSDYIIKNRDTYINNINKKVFNRLFLSSTNEYMLSEKIYKIQTKSLAYSILYLSILNNLNETGKMSKSIKLSDDILNFISNIRNNKVSYKDAINYYNDAKENVINIQHNFNNYSVDYENQFIKTISDLVHDK